MIRAFYFYTTTGEWYDTMTKDQHGARLNIKLILYI